MHLQNSFTYRKLSTGDNRGKLFSSKEEVTLHAEALTSK